MSELIQWPTAKYWTAQWNPVIGCKPCSPACEHCYAASWAKRFGQSFEPHETRQRPPRNGIVFCGNMTDLFGEWMGPSCGVISICQSMYNGKSEAQYLYLTKRVQRMCHALDELSTDARINRSANHYFGFTAENQEWYEKRLQLRCASNFIWPDWAKLWASCEPLLGPIDLGLMFCGEVVKPKYRWVVVGCESGPKRRPCKIEWVESIVEQCLAANVPVFVKQICLPTGKFTNKIEEFPAHLQIRQVPWAISETKGTTK